MSFNSIDIVQNLFKVSFNTSLVSQYLFSCISLLFIIVIYYLRLYLLIIYYKVRDTVLIKRAKLRMFCTYFQNIENLMKIVQNVLTYV